MDINTNMDGRNSKYRDNRHCPDTVVATLVDIVMRSMTLAAKTGILIGLIAGLILSWQARLSLQVIYTGSRVARGLLAPVRLYRWTEKKLMDAKKPVEITDTNCASNVGEINQEAQMDVGEAIEETELRQRLDRYSQKLWRMKSHFLEVASVGLGKLNMAQMEVYFCLEEVGQLPEKSEYMFDRYVHNFRHQMSNIINPNWKKTQFTYGGIALGANEGFSHYLQRKRMLYGVYRSEHPYRLSYSNGIKQPWNMTEAYGERPAKRSHIRREASNFRPMKDPSVYSINDHFGLFNTNSSPLKEQVDRDYLRPRPHRNRVSKNEETSPAVPPNLADTGAQIPQTKSI